MLGGPWEGTTGLAAIAGLALELWVLLEVKEPPLETALDIGCCMLEQLWWGGDEDAIGGNIFPLLPALSPEDPPEAGSLTLAKEFASVVT